MAIREPEEKNRVEQTHDEQLDPIARAHRNLQSLRESEQRATENGGSSSPSAPGDVRNAESTPWKTSVTPPSASKRHVRGSALAKTKRQLPLLILLFGLVTGGTMLSFLGVALAPVAFFANVFENDLNDQLAALEKRSLGIMFKRTASVSAADRSKTLAGCKVMSIRCKYKTMPESLVKKLAARGIQVTGETGGGLLGNRIIPEKITFQGKDYVPADFAKALKSNPELSRAYRRSLNMKFNGVRDSTFVTWGLKRFGIRTRDPIFTGSHEDRVNKLMNAAGVPNATRLNFTEVFEPETDPKTGLPKVDPITKEPILKSIGYALDGGDPAKIYSEAEKVGFEKSIARVTAVKQPPSSLKTGALNAISVLGVYDAACSAKNYIGAAAVAAKVANSQQLASYAMQVAPLAGKLKAGDLSPEDGRVLGEFFMATDKRRTIPDATKAYELSGDQMTARNEIPTMPNPDYGKNAMDSPLYKMSAYGGVAPATSEALTYSLGMGQNTLLSTFASGADLFGKILELGDLGGCRWVQNWAVRGVGLIGGIVLGASTGGLSIGTTVLMMGVVTAGMLLLNNMVSSALSGSIIGPDMADKPVERSNALWSGMAVLAGEAARTRGMMPGTKEQIVAYQQVKNEVVQDYIALEKYDAKPWDITNQYSTIGSAAFALQRYAPNFSTPSSIPATIFSAISGSFGSVFRPYTAYAASLDPARFTRCDDQAYRDVGIDADVQCNVRYVMPKAEMDADPLTVAEYMEDRGYVEKDTTTGLPEGYTKPNPQQTQTFALAIAQGLVGQFLNFRSYGATDAAREYGKFLDFCAYRTLPFGETYEESGAFGDAGPEWKTGKKCMEESEMIRSFRIYTFDRSTQESMDGEGVELENSDTLTDGPIAVFYTEPNFRGTPIKVIGNEHGDLNLFKDATTGEYHPIDDKIASVRVSPGVSLTLFSEKDFNGDNVIYTEDKSDIRSDLEGRSTPWASSYKTAEGWGGDPPVIVYNQPNFQGLQAEITQSMGFIAVGSLFGVTGDAPPEGLHIRSIRIPAGRTITAYEGINYTLGARALSGDVADTFKVLPWIKGDPDPLRVVSSMRLRAAFTPPAVPDRRTGPYVILFSGLNYTGVSTLIDKTEVPDLRAVPYPGNNPARPYWNAHVRSVYVPPGVTMEISENVYWRGKQDTTTMSLPNVTNYNNGLGFSAFRLSGNVNSDGGAPGPSGRWANPMGSQTYQYASGYGPRTLGDHYGADLANVGGTIYAACDGRVASIGNNGDFNTYGMGSDGMRYSNLMIVDCGAGVTTVYMHYYFRDVPSNIRVGTMVRAGQTVLTRVGNQGYSTGPHLHFEVHRLLPGQSPAVFVQERAVDPRQFMRTQGITL